LKCSLIEDAGQLIWDSGRPDEVTCVEPWSNIQWLWNYGI